MAHGLRTPPGKRGSVRLAEVTRRGRAALLSCTALGTIATLLLATPARSQPAANARPSKGVVSAGSATIGSSASTTTIKQSSQRTAIDWQSFDVGSHQTVDFIQPSSSSVALNRVISSNPSQIAGRIDANGQVILLNQSGVIFYQGAQVNTAGLIVSAAGMSNVNFMAGKLVFDQTANPNAAVVNQGSLTVKQAGLAALVAPQVANSGVITAKLGHVVLAGAKTATLDMYGDGMVSLDVNNAVTQAPVGRDGAPVAALVTNSGVIRADGGTVQLTAREADGLVQNLVQAGGTIRADSVGSKTGTVVLGGLGGSIVLNGVVTADGGAAPGSTGGQVQVDASQGVTLAAGSRIRASGPAGGGTVAIGTTLARAKGGPGTASALTAQTVQVDQGARVNASATGNGDGGRVTVLSSLSTSMAGAIIAKGGPQGGNGGFIETSGPILVIGETAVVNATAPKGLAGTWLLDPFDVTISTDANKAISSSTSGGTDTLSATDNDAVVNNKLLSSILDGGTNVSINTGATGVQAGDITVDAPVTWGAAATLTLNAAGAIVINLPITATNAGSVLTLNAGRSVSQSDNGVITVGTLTGNSVDGATLNLANTVNTLGPFSDTGASNTTGLSFNNTQAFRTSGLVTSTGPLVLTTTAGGVTVNGTVSSENGVTITATGVLSIPGTVSSGVNDLSGSSINITGEVTDGGAGETFLTATVGGITETGGTLIAGLLEGDSVGSVSLGTSSTNTIARLGQMFVSSPTGSFALTNNSGLLIIGSVLGPNGVYIESAGATGIQLTNAKARVTVNSSADVSFQADAFSIVSGAEVAGTSAQFELAPNTPGLGVTLGASGSGLSLASLAGVDQFSIRIGAVTLPGGVQTTTAGPIVIAGNFGTSSIVLDLEARGQVTENAGAALSVGFLTGTAAGFNLTSAGNAIGAIDNMTATGGDITVVDSESLILTGTQSGNNLFYEVAVASDGLSLGRFGDSTIDPATLTAATGGRISLVADNLGDVPGSTVTATNGTVELAPFSTINTSLLGSNGLVIDATLLSLISTGATGTLVIGGFTDVPHAATVPVASAASITLDGAVDLTGIASTLLLQSKGSITEPVGPLTVGTLAASGTTITLNDNSNAIMALGNVTSVNFTLNDSLPLVLNGGVTATSSASITDEISLTLTGDLTSPSIALSAGDAGIALNGTSVLGQSGATVTLSSGGGVLEVAGATLIAGTLASTGVTGGAATFAGTANAVATLGNFTVSGNPLSLSDTGTLTVTGAVSASAVTIGGAAGSTPTDITLTGDLTAPTITLSAGGSGIALNGSSVLGESGATVDLSSSGGVAEVAGATLTAGTLQSSGGVSGGAANFAGTANAIAGLGSFTVTGNALSLSDTGALSVTGPVTGSAVTIGGAAGSTPTSITLNGDLTAPTITLSAGDGGIALIGTSVVGQADAVVDLTAGAAGVTEFDSSAIVAATLQGNVAGPVLLGNDNTVLTLGSFAVTGTSNSFELGDTGTLAVTGPVTATGDVSLNVIGSGSGNAITVTGIIGAGGTLFAGSGLGALALETGAVLTGPTISLLANGIALTGNASVGETGSVVNLGSFGGFITEASTSTITAATLGSTFGSQGSVSLLGTRNAIGTLGTFTIFGSSTDSLTLIDSIPLTVSGPVAANNPPFNSQNVVLEASGSITVTGPITASGDIILATGGAGPITPPPATESPLIAVVDGAAVTSTGGSVSLLAGPGGEVELGTHVIGAPGTTGTLTAASGEFVTLQMDTLAVNNASSITAPGGTIEIAPATPTNGIDFATAASNTLTIPASAINVMSSGTLRIGAVTIDGTETTTAGAIAFDTSVDLTGHATTLQLLATGPITEPSGPLTVNTLTATGTSIDLPNANNVISNATNMIATAGDIVLVDDPTLVLSGIQSGNNLFYEMTAAGGTLQIGSNATGATMTATAASNPRITLVADSLTEGTAASTITATGGSVELAPFTSTTAVSLAGSSGAHLLIDTTLLGDITTGTLVVGAFTDVPSKVTSRAASAASISIDGPVDLTGHATTLLLEAAGPIGETGGPLIVNTLTADGTAISLLNATNVISNLGPLSASTGNIAIAASSALTIAGLVDASAGNVYLATSAGGGITFGAFTVESMVGGTVGLQTNALANLGTTGATGVVNTGVEGTFELAPATANPMTLGITSGLSLANLTGITTGTLRIGAVTQPGNTSPTTTAGSIVIGGAFGADFIGLDLEASSQVTQTAGAVLTANSLTGTAAGFQLTNAINAIGTINNLVATGGDIAVVDGDDLTLAGVQSGNNLFYEVAAVDGGLSLGISLDTRPFPATLTAAAGGRISLVADNFSETAGNSITATNGAVELAAFSVINTSLQGSNGLVIDATMLAAIGTGPTGTLVIGGFTDVPTGGTTPTKRASSISVDAATTIAGSTAGTLDLLTTGPVSQSNPLVAGTLIGNAGSVTLDNNANDIITLGRFTTTTGQFELNDSGNLGTLTVTGPVTAATTAAITIGDTGAIDVTGNVGASGVLALVGGSGGVSVNDNAKLTAPTIDLAAASSGVIALNGNSVVGQTGATVDLVTEGNITQAAGAALVAATLEVSSNAVVDLAGTANTVGALDGVVAGTSFTLNDSTDLTVNTSVVAPRIALLAPSQTVTLADGATIITNGTPPASPRPLVPADEPSNGAPGAFVQAASFIQVGTSTLTTEGKTGPTLQISVTNSATFDPPLGLDAPKGWLILNLGSGTATGNVVVNALNVTFTAPGSATLTGTIAGIAGAPAAASGFIEPAVNISYLFNGCEIGSAVCLPPIPPVSETPPLPPLFPDLPGEVPPLPGLPTLVLLSVPPIATPACAVSGSGTGSPNGSACALTDPDVVPPNVSNVDY
jgi:filamentous hemagglutinin family protein